MQYTKEIKRPSLEKVSFGKHPFMFENIFKVPRIVHHHTTRECRDRDLESLETEYFLTFHKP
jgi:hypothetical protein